MSMPADIQSIELDLDDPIDKAIKIASDGEDPKDAMRFNLLYLSQVSGQSQRFDETIEWMKEIIVLNSDLTLDERNLLSAACKHAMGTRRVCLRILSSFEKKEASKSGRHVKLIKSYREIIEEELSKICNDILSIIDKDLLPSSSSYESTTFYSKMRADYYRYLAEFKTGEEQNDAVEKALKSYETALELAQDHLSATNPIRLSLALNYSVFHYEILKSPEKACWIARVGFDAAAALLSNNKDALTKECILILQVLRENIANWASYLPEGTVELP